MLLADSADYGTSPRWIAGLRLSFRLEDVTLASSLAYIVDSGAYAELSGLQIIDVSNPVSPTFVGQVRTPDIAYGVAISARKAAVRKARGRRRSRKSATRAGAIEIPPATQSIDCRSNL